MEKASSHCSKPFPLLCFLSIRLRHFTIGALRIYAQPRRFQSQPTGRLNQNPDLSAGSAHLRQGAARADPNYLQVAILNDPNSVSHEHSLLGKSEMATPLPAYDERRRHLTFTQSWNDSGVFDVIGLRFSSPPQTTKRLAALYRGRQEQLAGENRSRRDEGREVGVCRVDCGTVINTHLLLPQFWERINTYLNMLPRQNSA